MNNALRGMEPFLLLGNRADSRPLIADSLIFILPSLKLSFFQSRRG